MPEFPAVIDLAALAADQGFIIQGDAALDQAGFSVSSAGDVNGDGFDDVIVGAPRGDDGGTSAGEAYVLFGSASGFGVDIGGRRVIDLASLTATSGFIIQGDGTDDQAGFSVSSAGDVNGDGIDDLIIGAPFGDDGGNLAGEAYVLFGSRAGFGTAVGGRQVVDLTALTAAQGFIIQGDAAGDRVGISVSSAGDVNGDGIEDVIVGAPYGGDGGDGAGEAYVLFGSRSGFGADVAGRQVVDLTALVPAQGFVIQGDEVQNRTGWSVSSAGDINGDGIDDLIVGAKYGGDGGDGAGEAYVLFGTRTGFGIDVGGRRVIDLTNLTAAQGFIIQGDAAGDRAGWSVSSAGDVNGDGIDDVIVGAKYADGGGGDGGEAYVVFGSRDGFGIDIGGRQVIDLISLTAAHGFIVQGTANGVGQSVSAAGDANGDGIDDLIVGATGGASASVSYLLFGTRAGFGSADGSGRQVIDLTTLTAAQGTLIQGDAPMDIAGWSVSSAGDVDGDGIADLIVGAPFGDDGANDAGEAYVIYGQAAAVPGFPLVLDLTTLGAADGFIIQGDAELDYAGLSVSSAGDVNGDGIDDVIVGAPGGDDGGYFAGEAYVVFGSLAGFGVDVGGRQVVDLTNLAGSAGFVIRGGGDGTGRSVSSAGDVNGDGIDDLIVGAPGGDDGGTGAGEAYVVFGTTDGFGVDLGGRRVVDLTTLTAAQGFVVQGDSADDSAGWSVSSAGDVNGDGIDDLIIGAMLGDDGGADAGEAYVLFGGTAGFGVNVGGRQVVDLSGLSAAQGFVIRGDAASDRAGTSVSSAGDVNGDGIDDLVVGAHLGDDGGNAAGEAYVIFGSTAGFGVAGGDGRQVIDLTSLTGSEGFLIRGATAGDYAGVSVSSAGDVNGDGFDDLIVGAIGVDDGGGFAGAAYVIFGTDAGFGVADGNGRQMVDLGSLAAAQGFVIQGEAASDSAGTSVSSAGDVNGDGVDDLIVGVPFGDDGGFNAGQAYVLFGNRAGFGVDVAGRQVIDLANLTRSQGFVIRGDAALDGAGWSVSSAGDLNGDGIDDLIVGAQNGGDGGYLAGEAYVIYGRRVAPNVAPVEAVNAGLTLDEGATATITAAMLDYDDAEQADGAITYTITTAATNGSIRLSGNPLGLGGTFTQADLNANQVSYAHNGGETVSAAFGFSVSDGAGGSVIGQSFAVTVNAVNDAPVNTVSGAQVANEDGSLVLSTGNGNAIQIVDVDDNGGAMEVTLSVSNGTITLASLVGLTFSAGDGTGDAAMTFTGTKAAINAALGAGVTYAPNANYNGADSIQVVTSDLGNSGTGGALTDTDTIAITVDSVNDAPSGADATVVGSEDDFLVFTAADFGFSDPAEGHGFRGLIVTSSPSQGQFSVSGSPVYVGFFISIVDINNGGLRYLPPKDAYGVNYASFTFRVRDDGGTLGGGVDTDPTPNTITITITADNRPPVAVDDDEYKLDEDDPASVRPQQSVLANDTDPDFNQLTAILVSGPSHAASFTFNADGTFTYVPQANFFGIDTFTYKANDGVVDSNNVATVTLTVQPANDAPVTVAESFNLAEDTLLGVSASGLLGNDSDVDSPTLTAVLVSGPSHALSFTFNVDGSFSYQATANYSGADSFSYRASDGSALGNIVTVNLNVTPVDDAAVAQPDVFITNEATIISGLNVFANNGNGPDADVDGPPLTVAEVNGSAANVGNQINLASGAKLTLNANGTFVYNPNGRFNSLTTVPTGATNTSALDSFTYRISSGNTVTVLITINGLRTVDDKLIGSAGNDLITDAGVNFNDSFLLQQGGNDTAVGLGGNDGFYFGAELGTLDNVDGGADIDSVAIQGNYAALVLGNIVKVENFVLLAGSNTVFGDFAGNFYDYNVTTIDANVAAGATLTVIGSNLRVGEDLVFNGAAETDGAFRIFAGQGNDSLTGGAKNDGFFFGADANLNGLDIVNGGLGIDSIALRGNYVGASAIILQPTSMTGVEVIAFLSGHTNEFGGVIILAGFDYDLRTNDANVAAGQRLEVAAGNLRANESLTFNGQAESDGSFRIISGAGDDVLTGGDGDDIIYGALGADVLEGRGGADSYIYRFATESTAVSRDRIVWSVGDRIDLSLVDAIANTGANEAFTFIGAGAFTGVAGQLRVANAAGNGLIEGDVNGDGVADLVIFVDAYVPVAGDFVL